MISLPTGTTIWIAAGITDLRRGFTGLSAVVEDWLASSHWGFNYVNVPIPVSRKVFTVNNIFAQGLTGSVTVGMCVRNPSNSVLTGNDWLQGYVTVLK